MINKGMMSSNTAEWATPKDFFEMLNKEFNFTLDPCATPENAKCPRYFTKEKNGLLQSWRGERVFCNPPYGREIGEWVKKCAEEAARGALVVMLIPARTDTQYFHKYIYQKHETRFIKGRLKFNDCGKPAPFPSMVVIMRGPQPVKAIFEDITEALTVEMHKANKHSYNPKEESEQRGARAALNNVIGIIGQIEKKYTESKSIMGEWKFTDKITEAQGLGDVKFIDKDRNIINRDEGIDWNEAPPWEEIEREGTDNGTINK